jgi:signal recognition particle GTPase
VGVPVYTEGTDVKPSQIARNGVEEGEKKKIDVIVVDTAGRLQVGLMSYFLKYLSCLSPLPSPSRYLYGQFISHYQLTLIKPTNN